MMDQWSSCIGRVIALLPFLFLSSCVQHYFEDRVIVINKTALQVEYCYSIKNDDCSSYETLEPYESINLFIDKVNFDHLSEKDTFLLKVKQESIKEVKKMKISIGDIKKQKWEITIE